MATAEPAGGGGAVVGSLALEEGDRWSDLDLTFAVADGVACSRGSGGLDTQTCGSSPRFMLFDLPSGASIYRYSCWPGSLQFDLSFTPASKFGATGPKFKLLFGSAWKKPFKSGSTGARTVWVCSPSCLAGTHLHRARRYWQPNTGSALCVIMRSAWPASAEAYPPYRDVASMRCRPK